MSKSKLEPTKPITTNKDVEQSNDPKIDQDMPGFPHHPSTEDDLKKKNPTSKINKKQKPG